MRPSVFLTLALALPAFVPHAHATSEAQPYRLITLAVVRTAPDGPILDVWDPDTRFVSAKTQGDWVRIDRRTPNSPQEASGRPLWISRYYVEPLSPRPKAKPRRYIVVDKSDFELRVLERKGETEKVLYRTQVAVGRDGCLPKEQGGNCYYTEPGEYKVRWKVHDPKGIEWCIPKYMEREYPEAIARGQRCFRGVIGTHALNIGKSYAIHGTHNPASLGSKSTHGCVRAANDAMLAIYQLMDVGDPVIIHD